MEQSRRWLIGALLTLIAAEAAGGKKGKKDDGLEFDPDKADAIVEVPIHMADDFLVPHIHLRLGCGACGNVNDVLVFGQDGKTYAALYWNRDASSEMQRKLGISQSCIIECRGSGIGWPNDASKPYNLH